MPITVDEKYLGRSASGDERERAFVINGTTDEDAARDALIAGAPATVGDLVLDEGSVEVDQVGASRWNGRVNYVPEEDAEPAANDNRFTFDLGGGGWHRKQSIATVASFAPTGKDAPDFKGAINVDEKGNVGGVDLPGQSMIFSETFWKPIADVDDDYLTALVGLQFKVANATFRRWEVGECLFLGASGQRRGADLWEITYQFGVSLNATGLSIPGIDPGAGSIDKKGWEYLWVYYAPEKDATAKKVVQRPRGAYVEQVYEYGNFADLEI